MNYFQFSSESVGTGHPDKVCDQISDTVLDEALRLDKYSRVAVETLVTVNKVVLAGEVTCNGKIDFEKVTRKIIKEIGYDKEIYNFNDKSPIEIYVHHQSADIALGVDNEGAGDQGMMFGYATDETAEFMPLPIVLAHKLCRKMDELEKSNVWLRPDGKSQVTVDYEDGRVKSVKKVVLAKPVDYAKENELDYKKFFYEEVVKPVLEAYSLEVGIDDLIFNGTGRWEIGGPSTDTGVTGRKIVVDTYGGMGRIGGGCFSGKDPTKVDRSAAYAARFLAKKVVASGLAKRCEIQLAYAIGVKEPVGKGIDTFGTELKEKKVIEDFVWNLMDLSVKGIIAKFDLRRPIYAQTAKYGHFGNENYPWESLVS